MEKKKSGIQVMKVKMDGNQIVITPTNATKRTKKSPELAKKVKIKCSRSRKVSPHLEKEI